MTDPFLSEMVKLDALLERCKSVGAFGACSVRDTSNRWARDWPWWSFEVEEADVDGALKRRKSAQIYLNAPAPGVPSKFEGRWSARIWRGENTDSFNRNGSWLLEWRTPSTSDFQKAVAALLSVAEEAMTSWSQRQN